MHFLKNIFWNIFYLLRNTVFCIELYGMRSFYSILLLFFFCGNDGTATTSEVMRWSVGEANKVIWPFHSVVEV